MLKRRLAVRDPQGVDHVLEPRVGQSVAELMAALVPEPKLNRVALLTPEGTVHPGGDSIEKVLEHAPEGAVRLTTAMVAG